MPTTLRLYLETAKHLQASQIFYRAWRKGGGKTPLKRRYTASPSLSKADISRVPTLPELDFDPAFLSRFDCEAILDNEVELLHHSETVEWRTAWRTDLSTPLWRYNLHYCEYLLPLAKRFLDTQDQRYINKAKSIILSWIDGNSGPKNGPGWASYTISMRSLNWLAFYGELREELATDGCFIQMMTASLAEQYVELSQHLEKDLRANHYLENLKALFLLSCFFNDEDTRAHLIAPLVSQLNEQILPDGMHFELSPMYHKLILEACLRMAAAARATESAGIDLTCFRIQDMCNVLYSLERNADRTPLFNDSGDNVAKSRDALLKCACDVFGVVPNFTTFFPDAGYCIFEKQTAHGLVKLIIDVGERPGPAYALGHAHSDAMSFECFVDGIPWLVNLGTFSYQGPSRLAYKQSASHNTVGYHGEEQCDHWASFRIAKFGSCVLRRLESSGLSATFRYPSGRIITRTIALTADVLDITDTASDDTIALSSYVHFAANATVANGEEPALRYAPEFGREVAGVRVAITTGYGQVRCTVPLAGPAVWGECD